MLLNFQKQFAGKVQTGRKRCTIRKRPARPGELLHLYTGLRTKQARRLRKPVKCVACIRISIGSEIGLSHISNLSTGPLWQQFHYSANVLARRDGFKDLEDMLNWFRKTHGLPFRGFLITW